jgi:hypothetical protein
LLVYLREALGNPNPKMKQELIRLFSGIIAGDGDIGSRMASSL